METIRIRDRKKSDPGSAINIPDPQHYCRLVAKVPRVDILFPIGREDGQLPSPLTDGDGLPAQALNIVPR
jgi:hypothetical protein